MNEEENIAATKSGFEASFKEGKLYDRQTQDTEHLERIIEMLHIQTNDKILDLGTGIGYVSFEDNFFDLIITRYALHHFPKIEYTFQD